VITPEAKELSEQLLEGKLPIFSEKYRPNKVKPKVTKPVICQEQINAIKRGGMTYR
jgi:hypothetical protein